MSVVKGRSYWRKRRDIVHSVESHVNELMEQLDSTGDMHHSNIDQHATCHLAVCESDIAWCDVCAVPEDLHSDDDFFDCDVSEQYDVENQSDSSSCSSDDYSDENLAKLLAVWATDFDVTQNALTALLHLLSTYHPGLPLTAKTVLQTVENVEVFILKMVACTVT